MPTPFESAQLLLTLYDLRREETMRKARDFWAMFDPQSTEEFFAAMMGPDSAYVRQVLSYWDMACSLVVNGAIDAKMFHEASAEYLVVYTKIEPILPGLRERMSQGMAKSLEAVAMALPDARNQIDAMSARIKGMMAARRAAAAAAND